MMTDRHFNRRGRLLKAAHSLSRRWRLQSLHRRLVIIFSLASIVQIVETLRWDHDTYLEEDLQLLLEWRSSLPVARLFTATYRRKRRERSWEPASSATRNACAKRGWNDGSAKRKRRNELQLPPSPLEKLEAVFSANAIFFDVGGHTTF